MTDCQEETINGNIKFFLITFALALHKVSTFYTIFTKES